MSPHVHGGGPRYKLVIGLNLAFTAAEVVTGVVAGSAALIADALHNLADVAALVIAWGGTVLARRPASQRFTYGLRSATIYSALFNAALLLIACGGLGWEAVQRARAPQPVDGALMMAVAACGILINGGSAALFFRDHHHDLNVRGAFLHLAGDAAISLGVCLAGFVILRTGWHWLDPATTLLIVGAILLSTWHLLRDAILLGLHGVPAGLDVGAVTATLAEEPGVTAVHDLHVWALSTTDVALTAHLVMPDGHPGDARLEAIAAHIRQRHGINHSTLQVELADARHPCALHAADTHAH